MFAGHRTAPALVDARAQVQGRPDNHLAGVQPQLVGGVAHLGADPRYARRDHGLDVQLALAAAEGHVASGVGEIRVERGHVIDFGVEARFGRDFAEVGASARAEGVELGDVELQLQRGLADALAPADGDRRVVELEVDIWD
jgi:hypothetical protein